MLRFNGQPLPIHTRKQNRADTSWCHGRAKALVLCSLKICQQFAATLVYRATASWGSFPGASLIDPSTAMTESNMLPLPFPVQGSLHPRVLSYISSSLCSSSEIASNCRSSCRQQHHQPLHPHHSLSVLLLVLVLVLIMALEAVLATSSPAALLGRAVHRGPGQMAIGGCPGPPWAAHWHERHARASMLHHRRVVHLRWVTPRVALHARAAVHGWRRCKHDAARRHELHALGHLAGPHGHHLR